MVRYSILVLLFFSILFVSITPSFAGTTVYFSQSSINNTIGDTFIVDVLVSGVTDLYGYEFKISFDSAYLACKTVSKSSFFPDVDIMIYKQNIDNTIGIVWFAIALVNPEILGKSGSGTLATLTFQSTKSNVTGTEIDFDTLYLSDSDANPIVYTSSSAFVYITPKSPINDGGGGVNVLKYFFDTKIKEVLSSYHFEWTELKRDINITISVYNNSTKEGDVIVSYWVTSNNITVLNSSLTVFAPSYEWKDVKIRTLGLQEGEYTFYSEIESIGENHVEENIASTMFTVRNVYVECFYDNELIIFLVLIIAVSMILICFMMHKRKRKKQ